jgi:hypothetical protein
MALHTMDMYESIVKVSLLISNLICTIACKRKLCEKSSIHLITNTNFAKVSFYFCKLGKKKKNSLAKYMHKKRKPCTPLSFCPQPLKNYLQEKKERKKTPPNRCLFAHFITWNNMLSRNKRFSNLFVIFLPPTCAIAYFANSFKEMEKISQHILHCTFPTGEGQTIQKTPQLSKQHWHCHTGKRFVLLTTPTVMLTAGNQCNISCPD